MLAEAGELDAHVLVHVLFEAAAEDADPRVEDGAEAS